MTEDGSKIPEELHEELHLLFFALCSTSPNVVKFKSSLYDNYRITVLQSIQPTLPFFFLNHYQFPKYM